MKKCKLEDHGKVVKIDNGNSHVFITTDVAVSKKTTEQHAQPRNALECDKGLFNIQKNYIVSK